MRSKARRVVLYGALTFLLAPSVHAIDPDLARFAVVKENQIRKGAQSLTDKVPRIVWSYFDAVRVDDWETATNLAARLERASGRYTNLKASKTLSPALRSVIWPSISEMIGAYDQFHKWNNKWLHRFGSGIINSIPAGSIYFGGTDPGRFLISALTEPKESGKRFFVLTQNQLADSTYLEYLRTRYARKIYTPTDQDLRSCFQAYVADAEQRLKRDALRPGEDVRMVDGRVQVSGAVAVMDINGRLVRIVLDKNPDRQFYIEESYRLDWMYPYLSPHGLIFQLHHHPLPTLSVTDVQQNQDYWNRLTGELIGNWLANGTSVKQVCDFAARVFLAKNLDGFKGDKGYARNREVQKTFSKLRSSLAGLYAWRAEHARDSGEKARMRKAADLAFRQAYALCPYSPEALFRYVTFLRKHGRSDDAFLLAKTSLQFDPEDARLRDLVKQVKAAR